MARESIRDRLFARKGKATGQTLGHLTDIRALSPERNGPYLRNKAGRAGVTATYHGRKTKAFQAHSPAHASFISAASAAAPDIFPRVEGVFGRWLVTEWVEGDQQSVTRDHCIDLLDTLHAMDLTSLPQPGFNYLEDFVLPRFVEAASLAGRLAHVQHHMDAVLSHEAPLHLSHPDVSRANVVLRQGSSVVIDNELLSVGKLPLLDACNAVKSMTRPDRQAFWATWIANRAPSDAEIHVTSLAWLFREAGSHYLTGRFSKCDALLSALDHAPEQCIKRLDFPKL